MGKLGTGYLSPRSGALTQLVGPGDTTTFGYDNNGNTTSMTQPGPVTTAYGYDYENRLTSVTNPSYTAAYTYSADGLRLRVQESNNPNPDRWMQYDGVRPVIEGTLSGDTFTTLNKYVWEADSYYDPLVYSMLAGTWRYHFYDGLGSTRQLMLHASPYTVTDTYSYEAFGNLLASTGTTPNLARSRPPVGGRDRHGGAAGPHLATYRYVGSLGYYQTGNDLMHLGARYYMPEVGRFTSPDPMEGASLVYPYADNAPAWLADPTGLLASPIGNPYWYGAKCVLACLACKQLGIGGASHASGIGGEVISDRLWQYHMQHGYQKGWQAAIYGATKKVPRRSSIFRALRDAAIRHRRLAGLAGLGKIAGKFLGGLGVALTLWDTKECADKCEDEIARAYDNVSF